MSVADIKIQNPDGSGNCYLFSPSVMTIQVIDTAGASSKKANLGYATAKVLELLIARAGVLVEREEIALYAWDKRITTQNNVTQSIKLLRLALDDYLEKAIIKVIPRRGYVFNKDYLTDAALAQKSLLQNTTDSGRPNLASVQRGEVRVSPSVSPPWVFLWPDLLRIPRHHYRRVILCAVLLSQMALLGGLYDWPLFFSGEAASFSEKKGQNTFIYLGGDSGKARALQGELKPLLSVTTMANPAVFVINKTHDFYEVGCLTDSSRAGGLYIHASKLKTTLAQGLEKCFL